MLRVRQRQLVQRLGGTFLGRYLNIRLRWFEISLQLRDCGGRIPAWKVVPLSTRDLPHSLQNVSLPSDTRTYDGESSHHHHQTLKHTHSFQSRFSSTWIHSSSISMWNGSKHVHFLSWTDRLFNITQEAFLSLRSGLDLCCCGLVKRHQSQPNYCSSSKSTSSQVQSKCPDVFSRRPFSWGCLRRWLVGTVRYPRMHFTLASGYGGGENSQLYFQNAAVESLNVVLRFAV